VKITLSGGRIVTTDELWFLNDDSEERGMLDGICMQISRDYDLRRARPTHPLRAPNAKPNSWLKPVCYELVVEFCREDRFDLLEDRIERCGRYSRGRRGDINVFQTGIMAIFAHAPKALGPRDRERFGKQLWHAFRHYVPSPFINGFIAQYEKSTSHGRIGRDLDSAFRDWIVSERLNDPCPDFRGGYPKGINDEVRAKHLNTDSSTRRRL